MKTKETFPVQKTGLHALLGALVVAGYAGVLFAQGPFGRNFERLPHSSIRPQISLPEACVIASQSLGDATNRFYFVTASCLTTNELLTIGGWRLGMSNTNGDSLNVVVYINRTVQVDLKGSVQLK
jgi:hypothetical protein